MIAQRIWAFIKDNEVKNTIICENYPLADQLAKNTLGADAFAVEITQIPAGIGDSYVNGVFKDDEGEEIEPLPTQEEEVTALRSDNMKFKTQNESLEQSIAELTMALTMMMGGI